MYGPLKDYVLVRNIEIQAFDFSEKSLRLFLKATHALHVCTCTCVGVCTCVGACTCVDACFDVCVFSEGHHSSDGHCL